MTQVAEEIRSASAHDIVVCDRSVLDNYAYLVFACGRQKAIERFVDHWMKTYDVLIKVPMMAPATEDGVRDTDEFFVRSIDQLVDTLLAEKKIAHCRLGRGQPGRLGGAGDDGCHRPTRPRRAADLGPAGGWGAGRSGGRAPRSRRRRRVAVENAPEPLRLALLAGRALGRASAARGLARLAARVVPARPPRRRERRRGAPAAGSRGARRSASRSRTPAASRAAGACRRRARSPAGPAPRRARRR